MYITMVNNMSHDIIVKLCGTNSELSRGSEESTSVGKDRKNVRLVEKNKKT